MWIRLGITEKLAKSGVRDVDKFQDEIFINFKNE